VTAPAEAFPEAPARTPLKHFVDRANDGRILGAPPDPSWVCTAPTAGGPRLCRLAHGTDDVPRP
jgi:hypothetical protein